jgi:hypothetical protein
MPVKINGEYGTLLVAVYNRFLRVTRRWVCQDFDVEGGFPMHLVTYGIVP